MNKNTNYSNLIFGAMFALFFPFALGSISAQTFEIRIDWVQLTSEQAQSVDWSSDGRYLAFGNSRENALTVLDWSTRSVFRNIEIPDIESGQRFDSHFDLQWSPDGRYLSVILDGMVSVIETQTQTLNNNLGSTPTRYEGLPDFPAFPTHLQWSLDSRHVFILNNLGYIDKYSMVTGEVIQTIDIAANPNMRGEGIFYEEFALSNNNMLFAAPTNTSTEPVSPVLMFWNELGNLVSFLPDSACPVYAYRLSQVRDIEWANDNRTIAVAGETGYGICRLTIENELEYFELSQEVASVLAWSSDQQLLAAHLDAPSCVLRISDPIRHVLALESVVMLESCYDVSLTWSPDSRYLAVGTNQGLWIGTISYGL